MSHSPDLRCSSDHAALLVAEQRLRQALRAGCIAAWEWNLATHHVVWSENAEDLLGLRSGHTREFEDRVHPQDRERHQAALKVTIEQGEPYDIELRFLKPHGSIIWIHDKAELQTGAQGQRILIGITADITARKTAEAEAREKSLLLEATLENMDQGLLLIDQDHRIALFNQRVAHLLDLSPRMLASRPDFEDMRRYQAERGEFAYAPDPVMERVLREGVAAGPLAHERVRPNGTALEVRTVPLIGGGAVRTFTDITARKKAEDALRRSEERARDFANIASDWFWETDAEFRYTTILGVAQIIRASEAIGRTFWEVVGADPDAPEWKRLTTALAAKKPFRDFEFELKTSRGRPVWVSCSGQPFHDEGGAFAGYRGVSTNITHRKLAEAERESLQEQLHRSQRLQATGRLAGGISHHFNNLLTVILGNAEVLAEESSNPALTQTLARQILEAAEKGADLTQKLLAFGRRQSLKPQRLKIEEVVREMLPILQSGLDEHIELRADLHESRLAALSDRSLLESAILNLVLNARDAMAEAGGMLTIRTGERTALQDEGRLPIGQPVAFVTVADTGRGMSPEVQARIFEPFFSIKGPDQGAGLGLPMVYGFTHQAGGHVAVESQEGVGTSVTIVLPAITTLPT